MIAICLILDTYRCLNGIITNEQLGHLIDEKEDSINFDISHTCRKNILYASSKPRHQFATNISANKISETLYGQ